MFAIFDAEGTLVGMITKEGYSRTMIVEILESEDFRIRVINNIHDVDHDNEKED